MEISADPGNPGSREKPVLTGKGRPLPLPLILADLARFTEKKLPCPVNKSLVLSNIEIASFKQ